MNCPAKKALRRLLAILIAAALIAVGFSFFANKTEAADYSAIRVKLSVGTPTSLSFSLSGNYTIEGYSALNLAPGSYTVKLVSGSLQLCSGSTVLYSSTGIKIIERTPPADQKNYATITTTKYGAHNYLGDIRFLISSNSISVVNHVYLEYYLYGVVPHEMSNTWPIEALKAQAVAARTYAVKYMTGTGTYDVVDTSSNQVYKGYSSSYGNAIAAVDATAKQVLKCNGKLVQAYFSASNGGYTEIAQHVWSSSATLQPYQVIQEDPYDTQNTWSEQEVLIFPKTVSDTNKIAYQYMSSGSMVSKTGSEAANAALYLKLCALPAVAAKGYSASVSGDIEIIGVDRIVPHTYEDQHDIRDYNGNNLCVCYKRADVTMRVYASRPATDEEVSAAGSTTVREPVAVTFSIDLHALDNSDGLYRAFNNTSLRLFVVTETQTGWNIYHRRYGHGVGLSQRGAQTRAKSGQTYQQILSFYYPSTDLEVLNISAPVPPEPAEDNTNALIVGCSVGVNIRSTPDTSHPAIGMALAGERITVTQAYATPAWHRIDFGGVEGYIYAYYVKLDSEPTPELTETQTATPTATATATPTATATATPTATATATATPSAPAILAIGTVNSNTLNVRSGPGSSYSLLGTLAKGDPVSIIQKGAAGGWHKIWYNSREACVYANYVSLSSSPAIETTGTVTSATLNVRSGPGTSYSKLGVLSRDATVQVLQRYYASDWHKILYNGATAYVHASYIRLADSGTSSSGGSAAVYATVAASRLNFRQTATLSGTVISTLTRNTIVQVLQQGGEWMKVKYAGREGYVYASYMRISASTYGTVTSSTLNVRSNASSSSSILGKLVKGDIVQIVEKGETWHKILYGSATAYVYAAYISF